MPVAEGPKHWQGPPIGECPTRRRDPRRTRVQKPGGPSRAGQAARERDAQADASGIDARAACHAHDEEFVITDSIAASKIPSPALDEVRTKCTEIHPCRQHVHDGLRALAADVGGDLLREDHHPGQPVVPHRCTTGRDRPDKRPTFLSGHEGSVADTGMHLEPVKDVVRMLTNQVAEVSPKRPLAGPPVETRDRDHRKPGGANERRRRRRRVIFFCVARCADEEVNCISAISQDLRHRHRGPGVSAKTRREQSKEKSLGFHQPGPTSSEL